MHVCASSLHAVRGPRALVAREPCGAPVSTAPRRAPDCRTRALLVAARRKEEYIIRRGGTNVSHEAALRDLLPPGHRRLGGEKEGQG